MNPLTRPQVLKTIEADTCATSSSEGLPTIDSHYLLDIRCREIFQKHPDLAASLTTPAFPSGTTIASWLRSCNNASNQSSKNADHHDNPGTKIGSRSGDDTEDERYPSDLPIFEETKEILNDGSRALISSSDDSSDNESSSSSDDEDVTAAHDKRCVTMYNEFVSDLCEDEPFAIMLKDVCEGSGYDANKSTSEKRQDSSSSDEDSLSARGFDLDDLSDLSDYAEQFLEDAVDYLDNLALGSRSTSGANDSTTARCSALHCQRYLDSTGCGECYLDANSSECDRQMLKCHREHPKEMEAYQKCMAKKCGRRHARHISSTTKDLPKLVSWSVYSSCLHGCLGETSCLDPTRLQYSTWCLGEYGCSRYIQTCTKDCLKQYSNLALYPDGRRDDFVLWIDPSQVQCYRDCREQSSPAGNCGSLDDCHSNHSVSKTCLLHVEECFCNSPAVKDSMVNCLMSNCDAQRTRPDGLQLMWKCSASRERYAADERVFGVDGFSGRTLNEKPVSYTNDTSSDESDTSSSENSSSDSDSDTLTTLFAIPAQTVNGDPNNVRCVDTVTDSDDSDSDSDSETDTN